MSVDSDRLIGGLVDNLESVKPLPSLRSVFAIVLVGWGAALGVALRSQSYPPDVNRLSMDRGCFVTFVGLLLSALGLVLSAPAVSQPGRDGLEPSGLIVSFAGLYSLDILLRGDRV